MVRGWQNERGVDKRVGVWVEGFEVWFMVRGSQTLRGIEPLDVQRLDPAEKIFFHIRDAVWHAHGQQFGAPARLDRAEIAGKPERFGARLRGAAEDRTGANGGRETPDLGHLVEHVEIFHARETVGADRDAYSGRVEAVDRRVARARPAVASRTRDNGRARRRQARQLVAGQLHTVDGHQALVQ